jgi:hypothetical protein
MKLLSIATGLFVSVSTAAAAPGKLDALLARAGEGGRHFVEKFGQPRRQIVPLPGLGQCV